MVSCEDIYAGRRRKQRRKKLMFVPLGQSDISGFYFQYPDSWKDEDMNVQAKRKYDPYMRIDDISAVYDGGNILSSGLSSDEDPDT